MNIDDARRLVLTEGMGPDGMVVAIRTGNLPSSERVEQLLVALESLYHGLHGQDSISRDLANALHGLTFHIQGEIHAMLCRGTAIRAGFIDDELVRLFLLAESILEDEWMLD